MKLTRRHLMGASIAAATGLVAPPLAKAVSTAPAPLPPPLPTSPKPADQPEFLRQALAALDRYAARIAVRDRIAVTDFSRRSAEMRFHIVDVAGGRITRSYLVSHGKGSDPGNSGFAQRFSNRPGSNASSKGSFVTGDAYYGQHGRSRRLHGLEPENDLAFARAIVIHGADYVDRGMAQDQGRIGRSLGCFAFERAEIGEVLELLGPGRLLFAAG